MNVLHTYNACVCTHVHKTVSYMLGIEEELDDGLIRCTGGHCHDESARQSLLKLFRWRYVTQANLVL